jgi:hypothetical protein
LENEVRPTLEVQTQPDSVADVFLQLLNVFGKADDPHHTHANGEEDENCSVPDLGFHKLIVGS